MPLSLCSASTQTHDLLISPQLLLAGDLSGHFENAVNSKLFCPQHNCVTTPFPADTFLVFSPTNKICEEKAKTENLISPHLCTGPHRASPATDGRRANSFVTSSAHRSQLSTTTAALRTNSREETGSAAQVLRGSPPPIATYDRDARRPMGDLARSAS